jgi:hypothetical protein
MCKPEATTQMSGTTFRSQFWRPLSQRWTLSPHARNLKKTFSKFSIFCRN